MIITTAKRPVTTEHVNIPHDAAAAATLVRPRNDRLHGYITVYLTLARIHIS